MAEKQKPKGEIIFDTPVVMISTLSQPQKVAGQIQLNFGLRDGADELCENPDEILLMYLLEKAKRKNGELN